MKLPTSAVTLEGYSKGDENGANREASDTNYEGIAAKTEINKDLHCEDQGEGCSSEEGKGRGKFHFAN